MKMCTIWLQLFLSGEVKEYLLIFQCGNIGPLIDFFGVENFLLFSTIGI